MMKSYCPHCGSVNEYSSNLPKFCGSCRESLSVAAKSHVHRPLPKKRVKYVEAEEYEDDDVNVPDIDKLAVSITVEKPEFEKMNEVIGTGAMGSSRQLQRGKVDRRQKLAEFQKKNATTTRINVGGE